MNRTPHQLGLAVVLWGLAGVFGTAPALANSVVLCKTWTGIVKARNGSCAWGETEIQLLEGPQGEKGEMGTAGATGPTGPTGQSAADLCAPGLILMSADNPDGYECHTPADILAIALCGNGVVDTGEQCDEGENNSDADLCRSDCTWNCPCPFFTLGTNDLVDVTDKEFIPWSSHGGSCAITFFRPGDAPISKLEVTAGFEGDPEMLVQSCHISIQPELDQDINVSDVELSETELQACFMSLAAYGSYLSEMSILTDTDCPGNTCDCAFSGLPSH